MTSSQITVALDGTGGDSRSTRSTVQAVRFALAMFPALKLLIFGPAQLQADILKAGISARSFEFVEAPQTIPQDETPREVLRGYRGAAMRLALEAVRDSRAQAAVSGGGTGPLVTLARHILGTVPGMRPALCARMPTGPGRFCLMLDLGANASCSAKDLYSFACLGSAAAKIMLSAADPRVSLLNVGSEQGKGPALVREARDLIKADRQLCWSGFLEANRIFSGDAEVIVTDGFTGNMALKAAEGVAAIFSGGSGFKKILARMTRPEWLLPWQYNGSVLLGVMGLVVKSHASAGDEALAVAMIEAARGAQSNLATRLTQELD